MSDVFPQCFLYEPEANPGGRGDADLILFLESQILSKVTKKCPAINCSVGWIQSMRGRGKRFSSAESDGVRQERFLGLGGGGHSERFKGCTHTAVILFDGAVDR